MKLLLSILFISLYINCAGQVVSSYNIGGISLGNNNTFSNPLLITGDKSCLRVNNGVILFSASSRGSIFFNIDCDMLPRNEKTVFNLAPNPAIGFTRIYLRENEHLTEDHITVLVYDQSGKTVMEYSCSASQLKTGFLITTNHISAGIYIVKIIYTPLNNFLPHSYVLKLFNTPN